MANALRHITPLAYLRCSLVAFRSLGKLNPADFVLVPVSLGNSAVTLAAEDTQALCGTLLMS